MHHNVTNSGAYLHHYDPLPSHTRRQLHRRSSCPSIPRSVSAGSTDWGLDSSSDDLHKHSNNWRPGPANVLDFPLPPRPAARNVPYDQSSDTVSTVSTDTRMLGETAAPSADLRLSDYLFDVVDRKEDRGNYPSDDEAIYPRYKTPSKQLQPPDTLLAMSRIRPPAQLVASKAAQPAAGTRPLRIDRARKMGSGDAGGPRTARPMHRAHTQLDLRGAYHRTGPPLDPWTPRLGNAPDDHSVPPPVPSKDSAPGGPPERVPIATLFPTGLIPLIRAQDKFKHAHCLDLPARSQARADSSAPPMPSQPDRGQRARGWSLFKKQKP